MVTVRKAGDRGHFNHGWLDTFHTFSFADYYDPAHLGFSVLRVINEDRVAPGQGFGTHPHRDMEILTYVISGALEHKDSMGNGSTIRPGDVQRMTAGTGITHSEFNPSNYEPVHLLQIWVLPETNGLTPSYEQRFFGAEDRVNRLRIVASRDGHDGSVKWGQGATLYASTLETGKGAKHAFAPGRRGWVQVVIGSAQANGIALSAGDGLACAETANLDLTAAKGGAELLLFDLP